MNLDAHYDAIATSYTRHWSYTDEYVEWMAGCLAACMRLGKDDQIADVGCGTGLYAQRLAEHARHVVCLDPSTAMLRQLPLSASLSCVRATAEDFATHRVLPGRVYDGILLKEVLHHLSDRPTVIAKLATRLVAGARLVIAMLPATVDYPLFHAALDRYRAGTAKLNPAHVDTWMRNAGLEVTITTASFDIRISTERYLGMVRDRYMSLLSSFDDAEIALGVAEIRSRCPGPFLQFTDRMTFLSGQRPACLP